MTDHTPNEPERSEPDWWRAPAELPGWEQQPAPRLIVSRPVYATALIDEAHRRARALHAEMVANGAAEYAIPVPRDARPDRALTARKIGVWVHACPTRQHREHPGYTCEEVEDTIEATDRFFEQAMARMTTVTPMADVPATLRGPAWTPAPTAAPTVRR